MLRGLSPRVRGNRSWWRRTRPAVRSIPACAGEPSWDGYHDGAAEVYPRVCGGTLNAYAAACAIPGLSPRVRGNPP